jgi:4'-phosphopantetheinyl transferase EntD
MAQMLREILPVSIVVIERHGPHIGALLPQERDAIAGAMPQRAAEFAAGRALAREALQVLEYPPLPVLRGPAREPLWPDGVVGSITHCRDYCAAAVAHSRQFSGLGIDAEVNAPIGNDVLSVVAHADEIRMLPAVHSLGVHWDRLLFSAKESLAKLWYPLAKKWLGFDQAAIRFDPATHSFAAELRVDPPSGLSRSIPGKFAASPTHLFTCIALPR